jgi:hypothetical protein
MQAFRDTLATKPAGLGGGLATKSRVSATNEVGHEPRRPAKALTHPLSLPPFTEPPASQSRRESNPPRVKPPESRPYAIINREKSPPSTATSAPATIAPASAASADTSPSNGGM